MDLDTGVVVAAEMHPADRGDTVTLPDTLESAAQHLAAVEAVPSAEAPAELVADKGYHSRDTLKSLDDGPWKTCIAEPKRDGFLRWHGDDKACRAVINNRTRLLSGVARAAFKLRAEVVERGFALILDRGGMRRAWLRGRENLHKRYLIHVAGYNLGPIMRLLTGAGTPREFGARAAACLAVAITPTGALFVLLIAAAGDRTAALALSIDQATLAERQLSQRAARGAPRRDPARHCRGSSGSGVPAPRRAACRSERPLDLGPWEAAERSSG